MGEILIGILSFIKGNKSEFYLENVIEKNSLFPRTFIIAKKEEVNNLATGALVKLNFVKIEE